MAHEGPRLMTTSYRGRRIPRPENLHVRDAASPECLAAAIADKDMFDDALLEALNA